MITFNNENFGEIRVINKSDNLWFVAADIAKALGFKNIRTSLSKLDDNEKAKQSIQTNGGEQQSTIISESGFYKLVFKSNLPKAKAFTNWITKEVLPKLKTTGIYSTEDFTNKALNNPDFAIAAFQQLKAKRQQGELL